MRKWQWIGHTPKMGDESNEKELNWNPQEVRRGGIN
jgi:hypothetical protein